MSQVHGVIGPYVCLFRIRTKITNCSAVGDAVSTVLIFFFAMKIKQKKQIFVLELVILLFLQETHYAPNSVAPCCKPSLCHIQ